MSAQPKKYACGTEHVVYRAWASDGTLLYVGATSNIGQRIGDHNARRRPWIAPGVRIMALTYPTREEAFTEEARAIREEHPLWNRNSGDHEAPVVLPVAWLDEWCANAAAELELTKRRIIEVASVLNPAEDIDRLLEPTKAAS